MVERAYVGEIQFTFGSEDPTTGGGVVAPIGSVHLRTTTGTLYRKTGAGNTAWDPTAVNIGTLFYRGRIISGQYSIAAAITTTSATFVNTFASAHRLDGTPNLFNEVVPAGFRKAYRYWVMHIISVALTTVAEFQISDGAEITGSLINFEALTLGAPHILTSALMYDSDANPLTTGVNIADQFRRVSGTGTVQVLAMGVDIFWEKT